MDSFLKQQNEALQITDDIYGMVNKLSKPELVAFLYFAGYPATHLDVDDVHTKFDIDFDYDGDDAVARIFYRDHQLPVISATGASVHIAMLALFGEVFGKLRKARKAVGGWEL